MNSTETIEHIYDSRIYKQVLELSKLFTDIWWNTNKEAPKLNKRTSYWHKRRKERETIRFIESFIKLIERFPKDNSERKVWKENIKALVDNFVSTSDLISMKDKDILLNQGLLQNTESFVNEARGFNPAMNIEDIGQAMRNVWIMNVIQMLLGKKVQLTSSIFGYSMLYPYTDNYLDDISITKEEKIKISNRLERRLAGDKFKAANNYEESIFNLVSSIESEYDRIMYPEVFDSLLCIHNAQRKSLLQQGKKTAPYEVDILGISIEKGGISVLADAYLVNGNLTKEEAEFFFGYGVLLQICDDLQDADTDLKSEHMTIISQLAKKWPLDSITNGLINFTLDFIDNAHCFRSENINEIKELIRKNCILLILFAIAKNKSLYSRKYFNEIKKYFPYRVRYMNNLYKSLKRKFSNIEDSYNGVKTEKIIMFALS